MNIVTVCLYITGDPADPEGNARNRDPNLTMVTIINSAGTPWKIGIVFFLCVIIVTFFVLYMIYNYIIKYQEIDIEEKIEQE